MFVESVVDCALIPNRRLIVAVCFALASANVAHAALLSATLPTSRSVQTGELATVFGTLINAGEVTARDCGITLATPIDADFAFQTADAENRPDGPLNQTVDVAPSAGQSFILRLTPRTAIPPTDVEFAFTCANDGPAPVSSGLNTLLFSASDEPTPDMVALSATVTADGVSVIPPNGDLGFFSVASVNLGSEATLNVRARATGVTPAVLLVCETNPVSGACVIGPAESIQTTVAANATPTFAVFLGDSGSPGTAIPFDPGGNRVFLEFTLDDQILGEQVKGATSVAARSTTATDVFASSVSSQVVQNNCITCHVAGGASGGTRLVFEPDGNADHLTRNEQVFATFVASVEDGGDLILSKAQGALAHGGGVRLTIGDAELGDLRTLLALLGGDPSPLVSTDTLFDTVALLSPRQTLRKAALLLSGKYPAATVLDALDGTDAGLRAAIRAQMTGDGFHQFLIEGANDRLLTDEGVLDFGNAIPKNELYLPNLANQAYEVNRAVSAGEAEPQLAWDWQRRLDYAAGRAPLELIAHVVENDLSYQEILTAPYIMANPLAASVYGSDVAFDDPNDNQEFQPTVYGAYYRDNGTFSIIDEGNGLRYVEDPGDFLTEFPHAGILNTFSFLTRYPSTATNRNRARARWTYYHFLGFDIEKSAMRTMNPDDLADDDNPNDDDFDCPPDGLYSFVALINPNTSITPQLGDMENDFVDWRARVEHDVGEDALAYFMVSTGHKSGGFNDTFSGENGLDVAPTYDEEQLLVYELGWKSEFELGTVPTRFNASAFYYDYTDQVFTSLLSVEQALDFSAGGVTLVDPSETDAGSLVVSFSYNAADSEIYGIQLDGGFALPWGFMFDWTALWLEAEIQNSEPIQDFRFQADVSPEDAVFRSIDGARLPHTPKYQFNGKISQAIEIPWGTVDWVVSFGWRDDQFRTIFNSKDFRFPENPRLRLNDEVEDFWSVDAGVGYTHTDGKLRIEGFVSNVTDEVHEAAQIITEFDNTRFFTRPRLAGVRVSYRLGD